MAPAKSPSKKGSRRSVFHGSKSSTPGGLHKDDLKLNKRGRIVSRKRSEQARKSFLKNPALKKQSEAVKQASTELRAQGKQPSFLEIRSRANKILRQ
jgi:hypothetical protein